VLQQEFGIGADEALYVRPAWEIENLMSKYARDRRAEREQQEARDSGY
jgi:phosphotransferase system HPr-like phosphotransfer protein